jgi:lipopolysaccharide transport system ATP-binding protein
VEQIGATGAVVAEYLRQATLVESERVWPDRSTAPGNQWIRLHRARIRRTIDDGSGELSVRTPFVIEIEHWKLDADKPLTLSINLYNEQGVLVFSVGPGQEEGFGRLATPAGLFREGCYVPGDLLNDGLHRSELYVMRGGEVIFHDPDFLSFMVGDSAELRGEWFGHWPGAIRPRLRWVIEHLQPLP